MDDKLYTTKEIAALTSESVGTLGRLRYEGKGPRYYKHGSKVRYRLKDVIEWQSKKYKLVKP